LGGRRSRGRLDEWCGVRLFDGSVERSPDVSREASLPRDASQTAATPERPIEALRPLAPNRAVEVRRDGSLESTNARALGEEIA
jgi:hypothetical protein